MINRLVLIVRLVGPRPVALAQTFGFLLLRRQRQHRLRQVALRPPATGAGVLRLPEVEIGVIGALPSDLAAAATRLHAEAEVTVDHQVDYLGSGRTRLGATIDWHTDFKSGYRWPQLYYRDLGVTRLDDNSDAKVPWELSRGHQLLTLARAGRLFQDERFALELERQLTEWIDQNPPHFGINWVNPMEIGIRAVNWIWAIATLEHWRPLESGLRRQVHASLVEHGRNIWCNIEGTPYLRSNHYLGNVLGLLAIAAALPDVSESRRWGAYSRRHLEKEITKQVYTDGVSFEGSLPYHGLALEMFLLARHIAQVSGEPLSRRYDERLRRMLDVSRAVRHPNGRSPVIGDQDSGRVLPAGFDRTPTHDHLLWLGAAILDSEHPFRPLDIDPDEEVAWTLGIETWKRLAKASHAGPPTTVSFPVGRLFILRSEELHVVLTCGDLGQKGNGGHGHNDTFSFELSAFGVPFIVDPGSYAYTSDVDARNAFRSTAAHNTVVVDGEEINPIDPGLVFELRQVARIRVVDWHDEPEEVAFVGCHDGYRRLPGQVVHRRSLRLDRQTETLDVVDAVEGSGRHAVSQYLHFAPGTEIVERGGGFVATRGSARIAIAFDGVDAVRVQDGWVSDRYGVREQAPLLVASLDIVLPARFGFRVSLGGEVPAAASAWTGASSQSKV